MIRPEDITGKDSLGPHVRYNTPRAQTRRPPAPTSMAGNSFENELARLKEAGEATRQIRLNAEHELERAKHIRAEAERYQRETETKARSQAQMLALQSRLAIKKEVEELVRKANAEIVKVLADIRMIRITAQEELKAQQKFTDAARICALSLSVQQNTEAPKTKQKEAGESKAKEKVAVSA